MLPAQTPIFATLQSQGPDPKEDAVDSLEAATFELEDGVQRLISGQPTAGAWQTFAGRRVVLMDGRQEFSQRFSLACPEEIPPVVLDLEGFGALLHPARGNRHWGQFFRHHVHQVAPKTLTPADVRRLCEALVRDHFDRPESLRFLVARCLGEMRATADDTADAWEWLEFAFELLDSPSRFGGGDEELFTHAVEDGGLHHDVEEAPLDSDRIIQKIQPQFLHDYQLHFAEHEPLESRLETEQGLSVEDATCLETAFDLLPKHFARQGEVGKERIGQRALANAVSDTLAGSQFLVADAPTGTGKTLAYLVPLLLWSRRQQVRVGLSTYTRALQEQAYYREVPRALELLQQAGVAADEMPRVCLLKGRANYICGRAIRDSAPEIGAGSLLAHATWMRLALFYAEDLTADLDGFGLDPGLPLGNPQRTARQARMAVEQVRAIPNCCHGRSAQRCGAGVRTLRAERSHLVLTNHAFVLARPEFFSHILFDECDHLHDVALSARSFDVDFDEVTKLSERLRTGRGRDRAPLEKLQRLIERLAKGDKSPALLQQTQAATEGAAKLDAAAHECTRELRAFRKWRDQQSTDRTREERAFLLHEYMDTGVGDGLATALQFLREVVDQLDSALRSCIEELAELPHKQARQLRWSLRRPLELLAHWREGLEQWLGDEGDESGPGKGLLGLADFDGRRRPLLALKCLLPQEWLGNTYLPSLRTAILVSATAQLRGGFKAIKGYLGLGILEEETLSQPGREVAEFVGPPTFDPKAALITVPEDAPPYVHFGPDAQIWQDYVEDSFLYLAERTQGKILGLFTNQKLLSRLGERLAPRFRAMSIPFYWQGMPGLSKEELYERFRHQTDSVLFGVDTFWYGVDFPGTTCQHVVVTKLPFGPLDDYFWGQKARMGSGPQRNRIYLPRALAMFRQGCGRLLRNERDRGSIIILDRRVLEKRHGDFLQELPGGEEEWQKPNILVSETDTCFRKIFAHMKLGQSLKRQGLDQDFSQCRGILQE